jgi:hypothetical protein
MKISREDWGRVLEKARDITEAAKPPADPMHEVHLEGMMTLLDELEVKYGRRSQIIATRADYLEDRSRRLELYQQALDLAKECHDVNEINEILDSINHLDDDDD